MIHCIDIKNYSNKRLLPPPHPVTSGVIPINVFIRINTVGLPVFFTITKYTSKVTCTRTHHINRNRKKQCIFVMVTTLTNIIDYTVSSKKYKYDPTKLGFRECMFDADLALQTVAMNGRIDERDTAVNLVPFTITS